MALGADYERAFQRGYEDGLKVAEWAGFDALVNYMEFRDWQLFADWAPDEIGPVPEFWEKVGALEGDSRPADEAYADGADQALHDLWKTLRAGEWRAIDRSGEPDRGGGRSEAES